MDDLPIGRSSEKEILEVIKKLQHHFPVKHLGPMEHFFGLHVERNRSIGTLSLSQAKYVDNILDKFDMAKCSLISTTLTISCKLSSQNSPQDHDEARVMKNIPIRQVLGSLSYLMSCTILVWSFQLVFSHKFIERPCINHWLGLYILEVHTKYGTHL